VGVSVDENIHIEGTSEVEEDGGVTPGDDLMAVEDVEVEDVVTRKKPKNGFPSPNWDV